MSTSAVHCLQTCARIPEQTVCHLEGQRPLHEHCLQLDTCCWPTRQDDGRLQIVLIPRTNVYDVDAVEQYCNLFNIKTQVRLYWRPTRALKLSETGQPTSNQAGKQTTQRQLRCTVLEGSSTLHMQAQACWQHSAHAGMQTRIPTWE